MNCDVTINDVTNLLCVGFVMRRNRSLNALPAADDCIQISFSGQTAAINLLKCLSKVTITALS